jgi:hypothetical protein
MEIIAEFMALEVQFEAIILIFIKDKVIDLNAHTLFRQSYTTFIDTLSHRSRWSLMCIIDFAEQVFWKIITQTKLEAEGCVFCFGEIKVRIPIMMIVLNQRFY